MSVEGVSYRAIRRIRANIRTFSSHTVPPIAPPGRPPTIMPGMKAGLRAYLEHKPWAYQDEMQLYLFDEWDIVVDQSTVSRILNQWVSAER